MASLAARHPLLKEHPCPPNHCTGRSMVPCASSIGSMRSIGSISILSASSNCRSRALKRSVAFPTSSRRYQSSPGNHNGSRLSAKIRTRSFPCRVRAAADGADSPVAEEAQVDGEAFKKAVESQKHSELLNRIASGEFTVASKRVDRLGGFRRLLATQLGGPGRGLASVLAGIERRLRVMAREKVPEARGDVRAIIGQPFFVPLYTLFLVYGGVFRLSFGPKQFMIVSDPTVARHILKDNAKAYSKGILSEILDFVMGTGLIPADGEIWRVRRRAIVPALHRKYVAEMVDLFSASSLRLCDKLEKECAGEGEGAKPRSHSHSHSPPQSQGGEGDAGEGRSLAPGVVEMESLFSRMTLDVIGKAVFNYEFDSLSKDTGIIEAVYVTLREAEARSTALFPYWKIAPLRAVIPQQRRVEAALRLVNRTLDDLIDACKRMVAEEGEEFYEEYVNKQDPSILRFLIASGDDVSSKQLRDDLMTMLIAGHETSAAVLTWTFFLLAQNPEQMRTLQAEVDSVLGDRPPCLEDLTRLRYTTRVINEAMRLYPQPPVLIRRALEDDRLGAYPIKKGQDIFISVWNLHRNPEVWDQVEEFWPERWGVDGPDPNELTENFSYLPFGAGPRKCVGDVFALYENVICVALLVRRFDFQLATRPEEVGMTTGATIHTTNGLLMKVTQRRQATASSPAGAVAETVA